MTRKEELKIIIDKLKGEILGFSIDPYIPNNLFDERINKFGKKINEYEYYNNQLNEIIQKGE